LKITKSGADFLVQQFYSQQASCIHLIASSPGIVRRRENERVSIELAQ